MRTATLMMAAAVAVLSAGPMAIRADATGLGVPGALSSAMEKNSIVDKVHCLPGLYHHPYSPYDECL